MTQHIALLGAGRMGTALTLSLIERGYKTTVWNRTRARADALARRGAYVAESVVEAAKRADIVLVILNDYETAAALLKAPEAAAALRGKLIVQLTSGTPAQARALAAWARKHDIRYLDGAIMAPPDLIGKPDCLILYAGASGEFAEQRGWLEALAGHTVHAGEDVGLAAALDSALLVNYWGALFGVLYGVAVSQAEQIPLDVYAGHVRALSPVIADGVIDVIERVRSSNFATTPATIETHRAALTHLREICAQHGIDRGILDAFHRVLQSASDRGLAQHDFSALSGIIR